MHTASEGSVMGRLVSLLLIACVLCSTTVHCTAVHVPCGVRYAEFSSNNLGIENNREVDPSQLSAPTQSFPWLVKIVVISPILEVICAGVIASSSVVLAPAHCLRGLPLETLRILIGQESNSTTADPSSIHDVAYHLENVILHPEYNASAGHAADLAVVKLKPRRDTGAIQWGNFSNPVCLPRLPVKQSDTCQIAGWAVTTKEQGSLRSAVVAHKIELQASKSCSGQLKESSSQLKESSGQLKESSGQLKDSTPQDQILCSTQRCNKFVIGPIFCGSGDRYELMGLPTHSDQWCNVGAYTRVMQYSGWLKKTIEYLDSDFQSVDVDAVVVVEHDAKTEGEENPCLSSPCGVAATCWNGQAGSFLCTCDSTSHPKGNPYHKCVECAYDNDCASGQQCQGEKCVGRGKGAPEDFTQIGNNYYHISEDELPWLQAQYFCMNKQGHLVELTSRNKTLELEQYLMTRFANTSFWVGSSDLDREGTFRWFYSGVEFLKEMWGEGEPDNSIENKEHCVRMRTDNFKFGDLMCETPVQYICEYTPDIYLPSGQNSLSHAEGRARNFDTLNPNANYAEICGRKFVSRQARIVGGSVANYAEWPWQVSLRQFKNGQFKHKCGAALLTNQWVITAAHCVKDVSPSNLMVRIGEYHVLNRAEAHPHIDRRIKKVVTHKQFDKFTYENDIALLEINGDIMEYQPNIIPICLPSTENLLVGQTGWVTGWGRLSEFGQISPVLREVSLPIISNSQCMKMYRNSGQNEWIPNIFLCAGTSTGGQDSCEGDSGGPLVVQGKDGRWQLAGIISWGIGCGDRNRPGVYTRISEFRSWISNVID